MERYGHDALVALMPMPARDDNKYTRGKLTIIGGGKPYPGAVCLAASASQRMGAGYTEVCTHPRNVCLVNAYRPSIVVRSWKSVFDEDFFQKNPLSRAYVVGPGMEADKAVTDEMVRTVLSQAHVPVLVDGGALATLGTEQGRQLCLDRSAAGYETVITPHQGEALRVARNLGFEDMNDEERALRLSQVCGAVVVLKGPDTFISDGEGVYAMENGTSALAKAGTGDVLAGIIGALLAQGLAALDASALGTELHALAGKRGSAHFTSLSLTAEDVVDFLPDAIRGLVALSPMGE